MTTDNTMMHMHGFPQRFPSPGGWVALPLLRYAESLESVMLVRLHRHWSVA